MLMKHIATLRNGIIVINDVLMHVYALQMSNMENSSANTPAQSDGSIQDVSQQSGGNIGQSSVSSQPPVHQGKIHFIL